MDRPLRRWTRPLRFFRLEALFPSRPTPRTLDRPGVRLRLEVLEDRVGPGEATSGVVAAVLGVSVLDPAAAGLALFGLTPLTPLADSPAVLTAPDASESTPIAPPIDPVEPLPPPSGGGAATPVVETDLPAVGSPAADGDLFAPLLDAFWAPFAPIAAGPSLTTTAASELSTAPAAAPATSGESADGVATAGTGAGTSEAGTPAPADIQPLQFAPPPPALAAPAPLVAAAGVAGEPYVLPNDPSGGMVAMSPDYGSGGWCGTSGGSGGASLSASPPPTATPPSPAIQRYSPSPAPAGWTAG